MIDPRIGMNAFYRAPAAPSQRYGPHM